MDSSDKVKQKVQRYIKDLTDVKHCPVINLKELKWKDDFVGGGGYGSVYRAKFRDRLQVVFKVIDHHRFNKTQKKQIAACREARNMCLVKHQSVVEFYGIVLDDASCTYGVVMELMDHGSLKDLISKVELPGGIKVEMMMDISNAMNYLHQHGLIHADMKLANIMIDDRLRAKLGDFGLAMFQGCTSEMSSRGHRRGTLSHMAPELFQPELAGLNISKNSFECDVWSFGITLYDLLLNKTPFSGRASEEEIIVRMILGNNRVRDICKEDLVNCVPKILGVLAVFCVEYKPDKRLTFRVIYDFLYKDYIDNHKRSHAEDVCQVVRALEESISDPSTCSRDSLDYDMAEEQHEGGHLQVPEIQRELERIQHQMATMNLQNKENFERIQKQIIDVQDFQIKQKNKLEVMETQIPKVHISQAHQQGEMPDAMKMQITGVQMSQAQQQNEELNASRMQVTDVQTSQAQQGEELDVTQTQNTEVQSSQAQQQSEKLEPSPIHDNKLKLQGQPLNDSIQLLTVQQPSQLLQQEVDNESSTRTPKQNRLVNNWNLFLDNLIAINITDYLFQEKILTSDDCQRVEREGVTDRDKARNLLKLLLTKGDKAIDVLCLAVRKESQGFLADALEDDETSE